MNKPKFCLAVSVSLTLMQANLLQAQAEPNANAIWQKMATAGASSKTANISAKSYASQPVRGTAKTTAKVSKVNVADGHSMLFLGGKNKQGATESAAPAAALTIHPTMAMNAASAQSVSTEEVTPSGLLAMGEGSSQKILANSC